jgi:hypothetical protein
MSLTRSQILLPHVASTTMLISSAYQEVLEQLLNMPQDRPRVVTASGFEAPHLQRNSNVRLANCARCIAPCPFHGHTSLSTPQAAKTEQTCGMATS